MAVDYSFPSEVQGSSGAGRARIVAADRTAADADRKGFERKKAAAVGVGYDTTAHLAVDAEGSRGWT